MCKWDTVPRLRLCEWKDYFTCFAVSLLKLLSMVSASFTTPQHYWLAFRFPSIITPVPFLVYYLAVPSPSWICEAALCCSKLHPLFFSEVISWISPVSFFILILSPQLVAVPHSLLACCVFTDMLSVPACWSLIANPSSRANPLWYLTQYNLTVWW